jgi:ATP-dependent DNA ligase
LRTDLQQKRQKSLQKAIASAKRILAVGHFERDGVTLFRLAAEKGLEGIVAKRADSPYRAGRSFDWIKIKTSAGRAIDEQRAKWNERPAIDEDMPPRETGGRFDRRRDRR